ncbi:MAG: DUF2934 domain-containing protein [Chroococcales cyanobacterium]
MSEITLCPGERCPIKTQCDRFTAKRLGRYDAFGFIPYNFETQSCNSFLPPYSPRKEDIRLAAYFLWQSWGCPEGKADECWFEASQTLRERR